VIIAVTDSIGSLAELRDFLTGEVPTYALPRRLVHVETMPHTAGGKIDRGRLATDLAHLDRDRTRPEIADLLQAHQ
jgi:acyl-CoA synthetase (AMP-forming)/AMP-acid ligase II